MAYDAGDEAVVSRAHKKQKTKRDQEREDLRTVLATPGGRAFIWRVLSQCGVYLDNPFPDLLGAAMRHEGKRHIGLWLIREITDTDPHAYARLRDEATNKENIND